MKPSAYFLKRKKNSHKGDYGRILIVAGSRGMSGAASLSALAALRSGAGLVTLAVPDSIYPIVARRDPEVMVQPFSSTASGSIHFKAFKKLSGLLQKQDVLAIGPGLSRDTSTAKLIRKIIVKTPVPAVIDADGLNALEAKPQFLLESEAPLILTPHDGEFKRIFGFDPGKTAGERKKATREMAEQYGVFIILKGSRTVVAAPGGKTFVNTTGNPGMATAGSGDVLTGILAALLGLQKDIFETICFAVYVHGLAGDIAAKKTGQTSLIARDILEHLPAAFKKAMKK